MNGAAVVSVCSVRDTESASKNGKHKQQACKKSRPPSVISIPYVSQCYPYCMHVVEVLAVNDYRQLSIYLLDSQEAKILCVYIYRNSSKPPETVDGWRSGWRAKGLDFKLCVCVCVGCSV